jgi:hypothetical protein
MAGSSNDNADPFAIGRQFWEAWTGLAQEALSGAPASWSTPAELFSRVLPDGLSDAGHAAQSMAEQGRQFMQFLQAAATRMGAAEPLDARRLGEFWRSAWGEGNPLLDALRAINAEGARGLEQTGRELLDLLAPMRSSIESQLGLPAFGYTRERQQHWQALQQAVGAHARAQGDYNALLLKASQRGMEYFENRLVERCEPGRQLDSARALYDLWVDAAEEAYAEVAMSPEFRAAYAELVNTQMRLRQRMQAEVEHHAAQLGLPTRSELDGTHRKIQQLTRELRALRAELGARPAAANANPGPGPGAAPAEAAPPQTTRRAPAAKAAARSGKAQAKTKAAAPNAAPTRSTRQRAKSK